MPPEAVNYLDIVWYVFCCFHLALYAVLKPLCLIDNHCVLLLSVFVSTGTVPPLLRGGPVSCPRDECLCQHLRVDLSCSSMVRCVHSRTTYKEIRVHFPISVCQQTIVKAKYNHIIIISEHTMQNVDKICISWRLLEAHNYIMHTNKKSSRMSWAGKPRL